MQLTIKYTNGDHENIQCKNSDATKFVASWLGGKSKHVTIDERMITFDAHDGNKRVNFVSIG